MSNHWFFAGEQAWRWPSAIVCLLLAGLILWLELRRRNRNTIFRILLSLLAVAALFFAIWQPAFRQAQEGGEAILLTANASRQSLDSLLKSAPSLKVYSLQQGTEGEYLPHPMHLRTLLAAGSRLSVLGDGPSPGSLKFLAPYQLRHLPGEKEEGLETLSYPPYLQKGERLLLNGRWQTTGKDTLHIKLLLAGKPLDSAMLYPESESFLLQHRPKVSGAIQYQLLVEKGEKDTLEYITLPLEVGERQPLLIGLFTAFPTFESKYLKNWLAEQGHAVFYQAEMAPQRYVREWLSLPDKKLQGLNKKLLNQVDLLLVDQSYFTGLSAPDQHLIEEAVKKGMGLLVLANGAPWRLPGETWELLPSLKLSGRTLGPEPAGNKQEGKEPLRYFEAAGGNWLTDAGHGEGFLYVPYGLGTFGISLWQETYPLLLKSKKEAYARQWAFLLNKTTRATRPGSLIAAGFPAVKGQRQEVVVWQPEKKEPELVLTEPNGQKQVLPLVQDSRVPERWLAYHWPEAEGTYQLHWPGTDSIRFQVLASAALPAWRQHKKRERLQQFIQEQESRNKLKGGPVAATESFGFYEKVVPLYWYYLLFLVCVTALWVERKINTP